jgi:ketosteroid isomerase-like protein
MSAYNLNRTSLRGFYDIMYGALHSITITNITVTGSSPDFVTWEMDLGFVMKADDEHLGLKAGAKVLMKGVAVQWWRKEEGEWKIWKERDYFIVKKE